MVTVPWHQTLNITIPNVYAPNDNADNAAFWDDLLQKWEMSNLPVPDVMLGDFNIVEDAIGCYPCRTDSTAPVLSLANFCLHLELQDE